MSTKPIGSGFIYYLPQTPPEKGVVALAALTALFYSVKVGLAITACYIGYKQWTWTVAACAAPHNLLAWNISEVMEMMMPDGKPFGAYIHSLYQVDCRLLPRPQRFFDILTSPYKPLGYWGTGEGFSSQTTILPSEATLQWVIETPGNSRLKQTPLEKTKNFRTKYFYNETYLKKLLELNYHLFTYHSSRESIFDAQGVVKEEGIEFFIRNHWERSYDVPLITLIHAAFGDEQMCRELHEIKIPNEPGLRDVILLKNQFPQHAWKTIQALLRSFQDVSLVEAQLQNLAPGTAYYVDEEQQIKPVTDLPRPLFVRLNDPHCINYLIVGSGPYRPEIFEID